MKKSTLLLLASLLLLTLPGRAQTFPVDTLLKTGPLNNRINLVFVSDGYQATEMRKFLNDVNAAMSAIFTQAPFQQYENYFNVFAVKVPSAQSGTTHPRTATDCSTSSLPVVTANTYFRTTLDNAGIHRAIVTPAQTTLGAVLAASFPQYTRAIVMVNTPEYAGTGGQNITMSSNATAPEVMIHEMGHTFGTLADEYWAGASFAAEKPNMTQPAVVGSLRWQTWVGQNGVGNFPFSQDPTWSKPHQNCKMQFLGAPFCSVCKETIIERIHSAVRALEGFAPQAATISNPTQAQLFSLSLLRPNPNTLRVTWKRDGVAFGGNVDQVTVPLAQLGGGNHIIRAEVMDTTTLSRNVAHRTIHRYVVQWDVQNTVTGSKLQASTAEYEVEAYPNPVVDVLNLNYKLSKASEVRLSVLDATGRRVKTLTSTRQAAGSYTYQLGAGELNLRQAGVYTLQLEIDGMVMSRQVVKQ